MTSAALRIQDASYEKSIIRVGPLEIDLYRLNNPYSDSSSDDSNSDWEWSLDPGF